MLICVGVFRNPLLTKLMGRITPVWEREKKTLNKFVLWMSLCGAIMCIIIPKNVSDSEHQDIVADTQHTPAYHILHEESTRYDGGLSFYVLVDEVDLDSNFKDSLKLIVNDIVSKNGSKVDITIADNRSCLDLLYMEEVEWAKINRALTEQEKSLRERHHICLFMAELDTPNKYWLAFFPSASHDSPVVGKHFENIDYRLDSQTESLAKRNARQAKSQKEITDEWAKKNISSLDGYCRTLQSHVKKNLKDPSSFEHMNTRFNVSKDGSAIVVMKYRARNSFGGFVIESVRAKVAADGKILECSASN